MTKKVNRGNLKLTAGLVTAILIISVAFVAILLTWALFSRHDDIILNVEEEKTSNPAISPLEIINPYEQQTLVELTVEHGTEKLVFKPDEERKWKLEEPEIRYPNKLLMQENLYILTNLRGQPLASLKEEQEKAALFSKLPSPEDFNKPDYRIVYRNADGSTKSLAFLRADTGSSHLFACYAGETEIWLVKDLLPVLETGALNYLNPRLLTWDLESIKWISLERADDGLNLEASKLDDEAGNPQVPAWQLDKPIRMPANRYNLNALVREFLDLEAARYLTLGQEHLEQYGLDHPAYRFQVRGVKDGSEFEDEIRLSAGEGDRVYGYSSYQDAIFVCGSGSIQTAQSDLLDLLDRYPIRIPFSSLEQIEVSAPGRKVVLGRISAPDSEHPSDSLSQPIGWTYNGVPADWLSTDRNLSFRRFYRSLSRIYVSGREETRPEPAPETQCSIHVTGRDGDIKLELRGGAEGKLYLFIDNHYTGLFCDRAVLDRDERENCGILLALDLLEEEANQME